jgi:hypothetical protein
LNGILSTLLEQKIYKCFKHIFKRIFQKYMLNQQHKLKLNINYIWLCLFYKDNQHILIPSLFLVGEKKIGGKKKHRNQPMNLN